MFRKCSHLAAGVNRRLKSDASESLRLCVQENDNWEARVGGGASGEIKRSLSAIGSRPSIFFPPR
jgi:hypothetical protein